MDVVVGMMRLCVYLPAPFQVYLLSYICMYSDHSLNSFEEINYRICLFLHFGLMYGFYGL